MSEFWPNDRYATMRASTVERRSSAPDAGVLRAVLDRLREGIQVWSLGGTTIYENVVMERMLSMERPDPGTAPSYRRSSAIPADTPAPLAKAVETAVRRVADEPARAIQVGAGAYTVTAEPFDMPGAHLGERGVLLRVRTADSPIPSCEAVTCKFGLTPRQGEVACLIARGLRNDEIARELDMSPSTARRHTECVLAKLGVRSRAEIAATLLGG